MKKVMFWGDSPLLGTGFGNVLKFIIKHLPPGYKPVVLGMHHNNAKHTQPYKIYSVQLGEEQTKPSRIKEIIKTEKPDILFILQDAWNLDLIMEFLHKEHLLKSIKVVTYTPIDAENHDPYWYKHFDKINKVVAYNNFGKSVMNKALLSNLIDTDIEVIEHGVDSTEFYDLGLSREQLRKALFPEAPELDNAFIFLNAGRNQPRKTIDISMRAFAEFAKDKSDVFLYMHCGYIDSYIDVLRYAKILGIEDKLLMTSDQPGRVNVSIEHLNAIYNLCDVGLNSGLGEGFGLPNAEHGSLGKPQIVPNHSALTDLYSDCGLLVDAKISTIISGFTTTTKMITDTDMSMCMNQLYSDKELYAELSEKSKAKFSSDKYSWANITKQWIKLFDTL